MKYHAFVDFDGTVTVEDVGYSFFKLFTYGKVDKYVKQYRSGKITAVQCLARECNVYNENPAPVDEVMGFVDSQEITEGFPEFVRLCEGIGCRLTILSAGFDFYIKRILKNHGLEHLAVYSSRATIRRDRIYPEFTYYDKDACTQCANCKGVQIVKLTAPGEKSIFIGDGHSDSHGAQKANLVFAKGYLASYLSKKRVDYVGYDNFFDVIAKFQEALRGKTEVS